jgi:Flp pilus assembly protein TadG
VEAGLLFPVLAFLTLAVFEYGWLVLKQHELTMVTREAARLAAMPEATTANVNTSVQTMMTNAGLTYQAPTYTQSAGPMGGQTLLTVSITAPYPPLTGFPGLPRPTNLSATVTMNLESP